MSNEKKVEMKVNKGGDNDIDQSQVESLEMSMMYAEELRMIKGNFLKNRMSFNNIIGVLKDYANNGSDRVVFNFLFPKETIKQLNDEGLLTTETRDPITNATLTIVSW